MTHEEYMAAQKRFGQELDRHCRQMKWIVRVAYVGVGLLLLLFLSLLLSACQQP